MLKFLKTIRSLGFEEDPDYGYLDKILDSMATEYKLSTDDNLFDWSI